MPWPKGINRGDGRPVVRPAPIDAELYRRAVAEAERRNVSIRALIEKAIEMSLKGQDSEQKI